MKKPVKLTAIVLLLTFCFSIMCSRPPVEQMPYVAVVIGNAGLIRANQSTPLLSSQFLQAGDRISVSGNSKVKVFYKNGHSLYLNQNTIVSFGAANEISSTDLQVPVTIVKGEVLCTHEDTSTFSGTYFFTTPQGAVTVSDADISIRYDDTSNVLSIIGLSGSSEIEPREGEKTHLQTCNLFVIENDLPGQISETTEQDIVYLKMWVGSSVIDELLQKNGCIQNTPEEKNLPPEWKTTPVDACLMGELFVDTVKASDPEGRLVMYSVVNGPENMKIDSISGIISFRPAKTGKVAITLRATDIDSQISEMEYSLTVSSELAAIIEAPRIVMPGEQFSIRVYSRHADKKKLTCRFDLDDDGKFELPDSGKFSSSLSTKYSFKKKGEYRITAELRDNSGQHVTAKRLIIVGDPPEAILKVTPSFGTINTSFQLDASESIDSQDSSKKMLIVRFDIDGDGIWDLPAEGDFTREKTVPYTFKEPGKYRVVLQVNDSRGLRDTASTEVLVSRGFAVDSISGPQSAHIGDTIAFECNISAPEFPIAKYEWNFNSDTIFEEQSLTKYIKHVFGKAGKYSVQCRVTDKKGQVGEQQKTITIENSFCIVDAGGPYKAAINKPVILEGKAHDPDSRIILFSWDFDGDGKSDWSSKSASGATHTFTRSGKYTAFLVVETDDGLKAKDSAVVEITNKPPKAVAGDDLISRPRRKVKLNGAGEDSDGKIILYEWDFDADGKYDWSSQENGRVEHEFAKYSTAVLRVMDSDSITAVDSIKVIICPEGMELIEDGKFCIDKYEWPGIQGQMPELDVSYEEAQKKCSEAGKHLCTTEQWEAGCADDQQKETYPYGRRFESDRCNTLGNVIVKNKAAPSGYFPECTNSAKVYDMSGNGAEWTQSPGGEPYVYGGSWQNGENSSKCNSRIQLKAHRKYFYAGFRCCK